MSSGLRAWIEAEVLPAIGRASGQSHFGTAYGLVLEWPAVVDEPNVRCPDVVSWGLVDERRSREFQGWGLEASAVMFEFWSESMDRVDAMDRALLRAARARLDGFLAVRDDRSPDGLGYVRRRVIWLLPR